MIKICLILGLILGGLIVDLGGNPAGERIGFRYWKNPGAFASFPVDGEIGKFTGWFQTLLQAAYSFSGMEVRVFLCRFTFFVHVLILVLFFTGHRHRLR